MPARDELLARLVRALRPGGILMVEEDDIYPILATATGAYRDGWDAFLGPPTGRGSTRSGRAACPGSSTGSG